MGNIIKKSTSIFVNFFGDFSYPEYLIRPLYGDQSP